MILDEGKPFTIWRALRSPEFYLLLVGCIAAVAGVVVWGFPLWELGLRPASVALLLLQVLGA
jgi:hypothetical protein